MFVNNTTKREIIRGGRRGGKTVGIAIKAVRKFKAGYRVLYAAPTQEQIDRFWIEVKRMTAAAVDAHYLYKNETRHIIEVPGTETRIRAKTAWNADTLRGDYADFLILDEFQMMCEDAWDEVALPMLLDNNGDATLIYTPLSLRSKARSKARDLRYVSRLFKRAQQDTTGRWATFHFTSHDNPTLSREALAEISQDMTRLAYRQEIEAEDITEAPGALWKQDQIDLSRVGLLPETLRRVVVGVDPPGGRTECGIVVAALGQDGHGYVLADYSLQGTPEAWSSAVINAYEDWQADLIVGEKNYGGDMVEHVIRTAEGGRNANYKNVSATRGKAIRAEPISAHYEHLRCHHVGEFPSLEAEMTGWEPDGNMPSPNRLDALVWALTELMITPTNWRSDIW